MSVMDTSLFGLTPDMLSAGLAILTGGVLLVMVGLGVSNPLPVRMGMRNMVRRPGQMMIMFAGLVLSTILITASFGLQNSFAASQTHYRLTQAGNVDEAVSGPFTQSEVSNGLAGLRQMPEVQAATSIILQRLAAKVMEVGSGLTTPGVGLFAVPPRSTRCMAPSRPVPGSRCIASISVLTWSSAAPVGRSRPFQTGSTLTTWFGMVSP